MHHYALPGPDGFGLTHARNHALEMVKTPRVFMLDADERVGSRDVTALKSLPSGPDVSGYFSRWDTETDNGVERENKLSLFRREVRYFGLIHPNVRPYFRATGRFAEWTECFTIRHVPAPSAMERRRANRKAALLRDMHRFFDSARNDFEVRVNRPLADWLSMVDDMLDSRTPALSNPPVFGY